MYKLIINEELIIHLTNKFLENPASFDIDSIAIENRVLEEYHIVDENSSENE